MSWFQKISPPRIKRRENPEDKKNVPEGLWQKCPACQEVLYIGQGSKEILFSSADPSRPARFSSSIWVRAFSRT